MAKFVSPLLGFNNNVRHKNRVFHIQTEDSGINHPHIITHLFMDGGRILKSVKTSYAEHLGTEKMNETVRGMMKDQHKAMFIALRDGQFDHLFESPAGSKAPAAKAPSPAAQPEAGAVAPGPVAPLEAKGPPAAEPAAAPSKPPPTTPEPARVESAAGVAEGPAPTPPAPEPPTPPRSAVASASPPSSPTVPAAPPAFTDPPPAIVIARPAPAGGAPASVRELTLDFDALERAAREPGPSPVLVSDLPPPPQNLFARGATGAYRATDVEPQADSQRGGVDGRRTDPREEPPDARPDGGAPASATPGRPGPASTPAARPAPEQRYAPARPAAIFGERANRPAPPSIFSDELISDKSLDEVILSYLAEDLEPPRRK